jgi:glycosyltransferase involved in cell wall biosynthesis
MSHETRADPGRAPLVSVLTPVLNGERYLAECIESVLAQTYTNWEYAIVDNASRDRTGEIARHYAALDSRIRVLRNPTLVGVGANHNVAFSTMSPAATYCKVVHADDWLFPGCLESMVALGQRYPSVGLIAAYRLHGDRVDLDGLPYPSSMIPGREIARAMLLGGPYVFGSPTSVMFRADAVRRRDPFFDQWHIHADEAACYDVLTGSDFGFVHQVLTYSRIHADTVTSSVADRMDGYQEGNLIVLRRYGSVFLTPDEYERRLAERTGQYYSALARKVLGWPDPAYWAHHRATLARLGDRLSLRRLALAVAREVLHVAAAPGVELPRAVAKISGRRPPRAGSVAS